MLTDIQIVESDKTETVAGFGRHSLTGIIDVWRARTSTGA